jgi:hypothetical protein
VERTNSYKDRDGITITISDTIKCSDPIDFEFFKENFYGKLIVPEMDKRKMNYEFTIVDIKRLTSDKEFELFIYQKIDPKIRGLGHYGKSIYRLTIKQRGRDYLVDKLVYLYSEI